MQCRILAEMMSNSGRVNARDPQQTRRACVRFVFRRRKGTEQARQHRYVDSPLVTGKPRVDRETGTIPWVQPMAQRTASFGSDPVGAPRCIGACPLRYYLVDQALASNGARTGHPLPHLASPCCGWWLTHPIKLSTDTRLVADCYARRTYCRPGQWINLGAGAGGAAAAAAAPAAAAPAASTTIVVSCDT